VNSALSTKITIALVTAFTAVLPLLWWSEYFCLISARRSSDTGIPILILRKMIISELPRQAGTSCRPPE
jgi:hypothetical protein